MVKKMYVVKCCFLTNSTLNIQMKNDCKMPKSTVSEFLSDLTANTFDLCYVINFSVHMFYLINYW